MTRDESAVLLLARSRLAEAQLEIDAALGTGDPERAAERAVRALALARSGERLVDGVTTGLVADGCEGVPGRPHVWAPAGAQLVCERCGATRARVEVVS